MTVINCRDKNERVRGLTEIKFPTGNEIFGNLKGFWELFIRNVAVLIGQFQTSFNNLIHISANTAKPRSFTGEASTSASNFSDPGIPDSSTTTEASSESSRRPRTGPTSSPTSTSCGTGRRFAMSGKASTATSRLSFRCRGLLSRSTPSSTPSCSAPKGRTKTRAARVRRESQI